jgi:GTP-binding protein
MKFIDSIEIHVKSGDGGPGATSFRSARNRPKLGPDGGNGGLGGDVNLVGSANLNTLSSLRYHQWYRAENGGKGGTNNRTGHCGESCTVHVPLGTVIYDAETGQLLGELLQDNEVLQVAKGGKRGYGNYHFLTSTHQAPHESLAGEAGIAKTLRLELKLLADVGLAGFPNAGKSTLLSAISAARPKIADYPFTTIEPNLGVVELQEFGSDLDSFVVADIPGLIEGASEGRGLGHEFLRHLERTRIIAYIVDGFCLEERDPLDAFQILHRELEQFRPDLAERKSIIVVNKIDLAEGDGKLQEIRKKLESTGLEVLFISGVSGSGLAALKAKLLEMLREDDEVVDLDSDRMTFLAAWQADGPTPTVVH